MKFILVVITLVVLVRQVKLAKNKTRYYFTHEHAYMSYVNKEVTDVSTSFYKITREQGALNATFTLKRRFDAVSVSPEMCVYRMVHEC